MCLINDDVFVDCDFIYDYMLEHNIINNTNNPTYFANAACVTT